MKALVGAFNQEKEGPSGPWFVKLQLCEGSFPALLRSQLAAGDRNVKMIFILSCGEDLEFWHF